MSESENMTHDSDVNMLPLAKGVSTPEQNIEETPIRNVNNSKDTQVTITPETLFCPDTSGQNFDEGTKISSNTDIIKFDSSDESTMDNRASKDDDNPKKRTKPRGKRKTGEESTKPAKARESQTLNKRARSKQLTEGLVHEETTPIKANLATASSVPRLQAIGDKPITGKSSGKKHRHANAIQKPRDNVMLFTPSPYAPEVRLSPYGHVLHSGRYTTDFMRGRIHTTCIDGTKYLMERPADRLCIRLFQSGWANSKETTCSCFSRPQYIAKGIAPAAFTPDGFFKFDEFDMEILDVMEPMIRWMNAIRYSKNPEFCVRYLLQYGTVKTDPSSISKDRCLITFLRAVNGKMNALNGNWLCLSAIAEFVGAKASNKPDYLHTGTASKGKHTWTHRMKLEQCLLPFLFFHDSVFLATHDTAFTKNLSIERLQMLGWDFCSVLERCKVFARPGQSKSLGWRATLRYTLPKVHLMQLIFFALIVTKIEKGLTEMDEVPKREDVLKNFQICFGCCLMEHEFHRLYSVLDGQVHSTVRRNKRLVIASFDQYYEPTLEESERLVGSPRMKWVKVRWECENEGLSRKGLQDYVKAGQATSTEKAAEVREKEFLDQCIEEHNNLDSEPSYQRDQFPVWIAKPPTLVTADEMGSQSNEHRWRKGIRGQLFATKGQVAWASDDGEHTMHSTDVRVYRSPRAIDFYTLGDSLILRYGITPKEMMEAGMVRVGGNDNLFCLREEFNIKQFCKEFNVCDKKGANKFEGCIQRAFADMMDVTLDEFKAQYQHSKVFLFVHMAVFDFTKKTMETLRVEIPPEVVKAQKEKGRTMVVGVMPTRPSGHIRRCHPLPLGKDSTDEAKEGSLVHVHCGSFVLHSAEMPFADGFQSTTGATPYIGIVGLINPTGDIDDHNPILKQRATPPCYYTCNGPLSGELLQETEQLVKKIEQSKTTTTNKLNPNFELVTVNAITRSYSENTVQGGLLADQKSHYIHKEIGPAIMFGEIENLSAIPSQEPRPTSAPRSTASTTLPKQKTKPTLRKDWVRCSECVVGNPNGNSEGSGDGTDAFLKRFRNITYYDSDYDTDSSDNGAKAGEEYMDELWKAVDEKDNASAEKQAARKNKNSS